MRRISHHVGDGPGYPQAEELEWADGRQGGQAGHMSLNDLPEDFDDLLALQRGVLSRSQALRLGLGPGTVSSRLRSERWQRLYHGVYAIYTGEPAREAQLWAALRRVGPDAVLSHQTAAELDRLELRPSTLIHITVPRERHPYPIPGIAIHRSARIAIARHPSLMPPRTRIEETALDLAQRAATMDDALGWLARACAARLTTPGRLRAALDTRPRVRWRLEIVAALEDIGEGAHSLLELRYVRDVERPHGLPCAQRQVRTMRGSRTEYKDALYEEFGVSVELDGAAAHPAEARWRDQHRDNAAAADGIITLRYSWADVTQQPCFVAVQVGTVLRGRGWAGALRRCGPNCPVPPASGPAQQP